jgi:hypothetical protein
MGQLQIGMPRLSSHQTQEIRARFRQPQAVCDEKLRALPSPLGNKLLK